MFCYFKQVSIDATNDRINIHFYDAYKTLPVKKFKKVYENYIRYGKYENNTNFFRIDSIKPSSKKRSIILLGCSFTFGQGLNNYETFSYKLSNSK